jgi:hypothetical protein
MHLGNKAEETSRTGHHTEVGAIKKQNWSAQLFNKCRRSLTDILDLFFILLLSFLEADPLISWAPTRGPTSCLVNIATGKCNIFLFGKIDKIMTA